jgi:hypothetical protein
MKFRLVPNFRLAWIPPMFGYALLGAVVAACYGIIHDQVTYSISPEYFTKMKFQQFHYANFGFPKRVFVAEVGVLATWWVGFIAAWFMARIVVPVVEPARRFKYILRGIGIMFAIAFAGSVTGCILGPQRIHDPNMDNWIGYEAMGVQDLKAFVHVAYIHNASYIGGLCGLGVALIYLWSVTGNHRGSLNPP